MTDHNIYVGNDLEKAIQPSKIYVGDENDTARLVSKAYVGNSSNKAVQVWPRMKWTDIYQKCEYLYNSTGTPYINLNYKPDSNTRVDIKFRFINEGQNSYERYVIGCETRKWGIGYYYVQSGATESTWKRFIFCDFNGWSIEGGTRLTKNYSASNVSQIFVDHTVKFNQSGGYFSVDESSIGQAQNTFSAINKNIVLFGGGVESYGLNGSGKAYVYYCKLYHGTDLIRDLVPCYRKNDLKPGMYDFVNNYFYTKSGSGEFYCGPDVND